MSYNLQIDDSASQRTIVVSEETPELLYNFTVLTITSDNPSAGYTKLITSGNHGLTSPTMIGAIVLILDGFGRGKCYAINTYVDADEFTIIDPDDTFDTYVTVGVAGVGTPLAVIHTAYSMYNYCVAQSKNCISLSAKSFSKGAGSPEVPLSLGDHTTYRAGTGIFKQDIMCQGCEVWNTDNLDREWKFDQICELTYKWNRIEHPSPVFLILTFEKDVGSGVIQRHNRNFFYKGSNATDIYGRGYLKGHPLQVNSTTEYSTEFTFKFNEAWLLS